VKQNLLELKIATTKSSKALEIFLVVLDFSKIKTTAYLVGMMTSKH